MRVRHVITVYINRKPCIKLCMASPITSSPLTLSDLEVSNSRFRSLISCKGAELGHILLLNINRETYMGSPMTLSHLTLSYLEMSNSRSLRFGRLIS